MDPNIAPNSEPVIIDESVPGSNESSSSKTKILVIFGSAIILLLLSVIGLLTYQIMTLNEKEATNTEEQEQVEPDPISDLPEDNDEVAIDVDAELYKVEEWGMAFDGGDREITEEKGAVYSNVANENPMQDVVLTIPYIIEDFPMCNENQAVSFNFTMTRYPVTASSDLNDYFWNYYFPEVFGGAPADKSAYDEYQEITRYDDLEVLKIGMMEMGNPLKTYVFEEDGYFYRLYSPASGDTASPTCYQQNLSQVTEDVAGDILESVEFE